MRVLELNSPHTTIMLSTYRDWLKDFDGKGSKLKEVVFKRNFCFSVYYTNDLLLHLDGKYPLSLYPVL